jgi:hypothetical protein
MQQSFDLIGGPFAGHRVQLQEPLPAEVRMFKTRHVCIYTKCDVDGQCGYWYVKNAPRSAAPAPVIAKVKAKPGPKPKAKAEPKPTKPKPVPKLKATYTPGREPYTTAMELELIDNLGRTKYNGVAPRDRTKLLKGYLAGIRQRVVWDNLDKEAIIKYAERALRRQLGQEER